MDWRKYERHPLSGDYEDIDGPVWDRLVQSLEQHGYRRGRKIVLYEGKILDGWQLYRACLAAKVEPKFQELPKGYTPEEFVEESNDLRRHESPARAAKRIAERRERIAARVAAGESVRSAAKAEGVSATQARRDAASAPPGARNGQPSANGGKQRVLCTRCQRCERTGQTRPQNCPECRDLNRTGKKKKKKTGAKTEDAPAPVDAFGNELPQRCRAAYADPWIQQAFDLLALTQEKLLNARLADGMSKRAKHYPFFVPKDFIDGMGFVTNYLDQLIDHLKVNRPAGVCPSCEGKGCGDCRMAGLVPRKIYAELKK